MSMGSRTASWIFPLTLAVLMGGVTFWLNRATDVNIEINWLDPSHPQYIMHNLEALRFNDVGSKTEVLRAESTQMFPNSTDVVLLNTHGYTYDKGQELYRVDAPKARYSQQSNIIVFEQKVLFSKTGLDGRLAGEVKTSQLQIDLPTQVAQTNQLVAYRYGLSSGTAMGFSYDRKNEILHLDSRVKAIIYDKP